MWSTELSTLLLAAGPRAVSNGVATVAKSPEAREHQEQGPWQGHPTTQPEIRGEALLLAGGCRQVITETLGLF